MGRVLIQQAGTNTAKALTETLPKNVIIVDEDLHQLRLHDGATPGGHIIGGGGGSTYHPDLFDHKWADHILNDAQWLRADTFSWQSGSVYQAAYNELVKELYSEVDYNNFTVPTFNQNIDNRNITKMAYNGSIYVGIGPAIAGVLTSTDGTTWTYSSQSSFSSKVINDIAWDGTKFTIIDRDGYISTSVDGTTWTTFNQPAELVLPGDQWKLIVWNGTNYTIISQDGNVSVSNGSDIFTWSTPTVALDILLPSAICCGNNTFVCINLTGDISTSSDGLTWTPYVSDPNLGNHFWINLSYDGNKFLAISSGGYISTSSDGLTWTPSVENVNLSNASTNWYTLVWNGTSFITTSWDGYYSNLTPLSEQKVDTINGISITYYQSQTGYKICLPVQEANIQNLYNTVGVAWYYIIDIANKRFKLPRTKFGFTGLRDTVGNYVAPGLPNITGHIPTPIMSAYGTTGGAFYGDGNSNTGLAAGNHSSYGMNFDASRSSAVYGNSTTVQPPATQMYLYFYVGEFTQTAIENTAGLNAELFNNKVDVGHQVIEFQAPTAGNNYTWYRKYADGWVEQGGITATNGSNATPVTLPVEMVDANYVPFIQGTTASDGYSGATWQVMPVNTATSRQTSTQFYAQGSITGYNLGFGWRVEGMAA